MRRERLQSFEHQVLPFRPRKPVVRHGRPLPSEAPAPTLAKTLAKYEGGELEDNYRHRMLVNAAALVVTVVLSVAGVWLAVQIADLRKNQDCMLSGRRNCTPIDASLLQH
jgi:hypothetical protein